ncbi:hypothetical protein V2J09_012505 [Rumex salicifolius]
MMNEASSSGSSRKESVVDDVGRQRNPCGYCKSGGGASVTHGLWAHYLTVQDYQDLLDQGWRRSGCYLYKPEMETTCCPSYTIRLRADDFLPSKEQLRVLRRMGRYLDGTLDVKKQIKHAGMHIALGNSEGSSGCSEAISSEDQNDEKSQEERSIIYLSEQIDRAVQSCVVAGDLPVDVQFPSGLVKKVLQTKKKRLADGFEDLLYTSNISFQIVAALRRVTSAQNDSKEPESSKCQVDGAWSSYKCSPQIIAERITHAMQNHIETPDLTVRACNGHINFYSALKQEVCDKQDDSAVASSKSGNLGKSKEHKKGVGEPLTKKRKFEIHLKRSTFDPVEFALYKKYQIVVHNDKPNKVTESSYRGFLVDSPLIYVPPTMDHTVPPCGFGSFHQQYLIDGKLIAVGVIDILPKCISSKYLFWDPDYAFLSLGKFSALKEIECVKENSRCCPSLQYYYLGYYIHTCRKMRYKAAYRPSELLCPLHYQWVPFATAKPMLDRRKYSVLSDPSTSQTQGPLLPAPETLTEQEDDDLHNGDSNDIHVEGDNEMRDSDSESSDDELLPDTNSSLSEAYDVSNTLVALNGYRLKYKDLQRLLDRAQRDHLESQLRRYIKVVGPQLAERMVYSLS